MFTRSSKYKRIIDLLGIKKPLVILDIETTGPVISTDKIIEIAYLKVWDNGMIKRDDIYFDPEMPIGSESITIHGITNEALDGRPIFRDKAQELFDIFNDCYYGGYNVLNFDLPILRREFVRVGMDFEYKHGQVIDSKEIFNYMEPKNLSAAYIHYCRKKMKQKHQQNALADTEAAAEIMLCQIEKYNEMMNVEFIENIYGGEKDLYRDNSEKFYWYHGKTYFAFSKYKDRLLADIVNDDPEFLRWILTANFSEETKGIIRMALKNNKNKKNTGNG